MSRSAKTKEREHNYYLANRDKKISYQKTWAKDNKERVALHKIKYTYGLSEKEYKDLLESQKGRCKICKKEGKLHIDHDHATGMVRGLLCPKCNKALGLFGENLETLQSAHVYMIEAKWKKES